MSIEKTTRLNYLYDFYQSLLTEKQRSYMEMYYEDDLSLGEIAEQFEVSRQAIYDNIRRTEQVLEEYEQKLGLFQKFLRRQELIIELQKYINENSSTSCTEPLQAVLEELENLE